MTIIEALIKVRNDLRTWMANSLSCAAIDKAVSTPKTLTNETVCDTITFYNKHGEMLCETDVFAHVAERGYTPKLKVEDNKWHASYDDGTTWEVVGETGAVIIKTLTEEEYNNLTTYDDDTIYVVL